MSDSTPGYQRFFAELKRRRVFRVMAVYGFVGFGLIQVVDLAVPFLLLPDVTYRLVLFLLLVGFPIALVLAWAFELTPEGVRRTESASPEEIEEIVSQPASKRWPSGVLALVGLALLIGGWWIGRQGGGSGPELSSGTPAGFDPTHVAVLYFDDTSADGDLGYFARGLTETAIHELTKVDRLHVISPNGVSGLRDVSFDSVARTLSVGTVIDGTVTRSGVRIRVTAQMIETNGMTQIASIRRESMGGEDWLAVVDSIVGGIAVSFRRKLGVEVRVRERAAGTNNERAWKLVQQAEQLREQAAPFMGAGDVAGAEPILHRADSLLIIASSLDASWPEPVVLRGWVAADLADLLVPALGYDPRWIDRGLQRAEDAMARQPASPEAFELRGFLRYQKLQAVAHPSCDLIEAAEADLRRAVEIDDSRVRAWVTLADLLQYAKGSFAAARNAAGAAYERDAFLSDAPDILFTLATLSADLEDYDEAIRRAETGRHRFPADPKFPATELHILTQGGAPDVARGWELVEAAERLSSPRTRRMTAAIMRGKMAAVLARAGLADSARAVLRRARAESPAAALESLLQEEAHARLLLGDRETALDALGSYLDANPDERAYAAVDPWWRDLHGDPRFEAFVERGADESYACGDA
jgi:TolB-like protein/tetratricopeptide (TPR) repeat protein